MDVDGTTFVFTDAAATAYAAGPWVADRPADQVFKYDSDASEPAVGALAAVPSSLVSESEPPGTQQHAAVHFERGQRRRVLGRLLRGLDALRATQTWSRLTADRKKVMLSSGGFGAGTVWNAIPTRPQWQFSSARWQTATRARLGFLRAPTGSTCQLPKGDEGEETVCGKVLDQHVVHPALCDAGATKLRTHNALKFVLAQDLRNEGAFVDVECRVPDLYKRLPNGEIREAILDLVVEWPGAGRRHLIDVTVRCPHALRYGNSASKVGAAAAAGDKDKFDHYGPTVSPFAVESFWALW
jgi:hypothetical protein